MEGSGQRIETIAGRKGREQREKERCGKERKGGKGKEGKGEKTGKWYCLVRDLK